MSLGCITNYIIANAGHSELGRGDTQGQLIALILMYSCFKGMNKISILSFVSTLLCWVCKHCQLHFMHLLSSCTILYFWHSLPHLSLLSFYLFATLCVWFILDKQTIPDVVTRIVSVLQRLEWHGFLNCTYSANKILKLLNIWSALCMYTELNLQ